MCMIVTGGSGRLGKELQKNFPDALFPRHFELDITNKDSVREYFQTNTPDTVIHAAALTDVRSCEENWKKAESVNIGGTGNIVEACESCCTKLVYISTACVFDGENAPFSENSKPSPKNFYSITKYSAEHFVRQMKGESLIIRTNFVPREKWKFPCAFTDRYGTYLFSDDVARAIKNVYSKLSGIVHICGSRRMSMFELARITTPDVQPMTLDKYHGPPLTRDMSLVSERIDPFPLTY